MLFLTVAYQNHTCSRSLWCFQVMRAASKFWHVLHWPRFVPLNLNQFGWIFYQPSLYEPTHHLKHIISFNRIYGFDRLLSRITSFFHWFWWLVGNAIFRYAGPLKVGHDSIMGYNTQKWKLLYYSAKNETMWEKLSWPTLMSASVSQSDAKCNYIEFTLNKWPMNSSHHTLCQGSDRAHT